MSFLSPQLLENRYLRSLVLLLVLAALAWQLSIAIWSVVPVSASAQQLPPPAAVIQREQTPTAADYQAQATEIANVFLFGKVVEQKPVQVATEAPSTTLKYKLRGIYFSDPAEQSSAIIEIKPNDSQFYRIDDELADKIFLASIEQDHILIDRYGKLERLDLEKKVGGANNQGAAIRAEGGGSADQAAVLRSYKRRYANNPMALATRFQAIPVQENGANVGFRLKPLRGESLLKRLDFQANDVFTSINGANLANPFEALDALRSLTTADSVTVTFLRNGVPQTRDFSL